MASLFKLTAQKAKKVKANEMKISHFEFGENLFSNV